VGHNCTHDVYVIAITKLKKLVKNTKTQKIKITQVAQKLINPCYRKISNARSFVM
jgi:hypothetical protein